MKQKLHHNNSHYNNQNNYASIRYKIKYVLFIKIRLD